MISARAPEHLERVRIGAERLAHGLAGSPVRLAAVGADEILGRRDEPLGPGEGEGEHASVIDVGVLVGEPPRVRAHRGLEHDARPQRFLCIGAALREEILRPDNDEGSGFRLASIGRGPGDVGFYRVQKEGARLRVWYIRTLHETFRLYVDENDTVRCEHDVRFLGLRVLTLHYRIASAAVSPEMAARPAQAMTGCP